MTRKSTKIKNIVAAFCLVLLFPAKAAASFPRLKGYVNDPVEKINSRYTRRIERIIDELEHKTGTEIYIAVVENLDGYSADEYGAILYKKWRIGYRKKDQGVLLLVSLERRKVRIVVGKGLQKIISPSKCERLRKKEMIPLFSKQEYAAGILIGVSGIANLISKAKGIKIKALNFKTKTKVILDPVVISLYSFMFIVLLVLIGVPFFTRILPYLKRRSAQKAELSSAKEPPHLPQ